MEWASKSINDPQRLAALKKTELLDSPAEAEFDRITRLAAKLLDAPIALVSLVAADHQFFKSCFGLPEPTERRVSLSHSFCQHVVSSKSIVEVSDGRAHPTFGHHLAMRDLGVIAYLGAPLTTAEGHAIGTLCVIDGEPRDWSETDRSILADLAALVTAELQSRQHARDAAEIEQRFHESTEELIREHRFLEAVLENVADGIVACDETGTLKLFNRATREFHGLSEEPLPPEEWSSRYSLYRADGVTPMEMHDVPLYRAFEGEVQKNVEMVIAPKSNLPRRRVVANGNVLRDSEGRRLGAVVAMHDITERAVAEERFRVLFDCSSEAHFLVEDGRILDCNAAAMDLLGCTDKAELSKHHPADFSPEYQPDGRLSAEKRREVDLAVSLSGFRRFEWTLRKRDGTEVPVEVSLTPIKLNGKDNMIAVCHDLSKRKQDERALSEAKRFAEKIAEHSRCAIFVSDMKTRTVLYSNQEARDFLGCESRQVTQGGADFDRNFFHPDDLPTVVSVRQSIPSLHDGQVLEYTARCRHAKGDWRSLLFRQVVFKRDENGKPCQMMGTAQDITELLKTQEELKIAKEAAEAATRAKTEFLANMSHEIRTPMTAILGYADLLIDSSHSEADRADYAEVVRRNGQHLLQVLNDILDISKIEAGKLSLEVLACDPAEVLGEVKTLMSPLAEKKNLKFEFETRGEISTQFRTDPTRLKQILLNLVGNAIKFTDQGSVRVVAGVENAVLKVDVCDTGIGISAQQQQNVFTAFSQADTSVNRRFGGSGLGLAISRRLAHMLGGDLSVASEMGSGSVFTVTVASFANEGQASAAGGSESRAKARAISSTTKPVRGRILVAEDTADTRRLVTLYLERAGATVEAVSNGLLAVDAVAAAAREGKPFDALLIDIQMPEMDGHAATAALRQMGFTRLPIIAFTAHAMQEERERCIRSGCNDCVTKPIDYNELMAVLSRCTEMVEQPEPQREAKAIRQTEPDERLLRMLSEAYVAGLPEHVAVMANSLAAHDLNTLRLKLHQLRGSGGSYGFSVLSQLAAQAESTIELSASLEQIAAEVQAVVSMVRRIDGYDLEAEKRLTRPTPTSFLTDGP